MHTVGKIHLDLHRPLRAGLVEVVRAPLLCSSLQFLSTYLQICSLLCYFCFLSSGGTLKDQITDLWGSWCGGHRYNLVLILDDPLTSLLFLSIRLIFGSLVSCYVCYIFTRHFKILCSLGSMLEGGCKRAHFLFSSMHRLHCQAESIFNRSLLIYSWFFLFPRYTVYWVLLLTAKLAFSFYVEVPFFYVWFVALVNIMSSKKIK